MYVYVYVYVYMYVYVHVYVYVYMFSRGRQLVSFRFENRRLCQIIEINNNQHVYCQSQVRKPIGSEVKWAECSLIIGTGCWVLFFFSLDPR